MPVKPSAGKSVRVPAPLLIVLFFIGMAAAGLFAGTLAGGGIAAASMPVQNQPLPQSTPGKMAPDLQRSSRIPWQDGSYFLSGVNYPQYVYYGGDIATLSSVDDSCTWAYSSSFDYAAIDADFADMQANGVHVVRWWLFGDGRGAPEFDLDRMVTGFDATFFDHMDQAMEIAKRHNIYIIWTLWDFLAFQQANWLCGGTSLNQAYNEADKLPPQLSERYLEHLKMAQAAPPGWLPGSAPPGRGSALGGRCMIYAGGHRNLVTDTSPGGAQDSFFNNALIPMLQRYANNGNIIGWEIMNEPEWALTMNQYTGQNPTVPEPVDIAQMRAFFARFTQAVHTYAPNQYATVGSASLKFMGFGPYLESGIWSGLGFDYYGAHYYGWMESQYNNGSPLAIDYNSTQQQLDAPVVIGELPANGGSAPIYLPSVRRSPTETSTLSLRYICTAYAPANEPDCTRSYTVKIEYYNANGTIFQTQSVVIPPYGGWTGLVPAGAGSFSGSARIVSNGPVAAAITQTGMLSAAEEVAYTGQDQGNLTTWLPRITNQGTHRSRIAVQNPGVHPATVTLNYYDQAGTVAATHSVTLAARGSTLIDPLLPGSPPGAPAGFQGSAVIVSSRPLVATAYELDPQLGSDSYNGEGQGYRNAVYLPSVRNWGTSGDPTIYVQNPCCATANITISYYNNAGTLAASQNLTLPLYGSAAVQPSAVLPGGFEGGVIIGSDQYPAAVMRSVTTNGAVNTTMLYSGTQNPDQRLHFPVVHRRNADGSGQDTSLAVQNVSPGRPITVWVMLNDNNGSQVYFSDAITIQPQGQWVASISSLPGVPAGFSGTAEILWPWPSSTGWQEGFPLLATAYDIDSARSRSSAYRGITSRSQGWAVTPYTPEQLLEGIYGKNWAGALAWSYYEHGTGSWDDFQPASKAFDAAHPAEVRIGQTRYTPEPTPANGGTATALAATNTPAYGNGATATAVARLTGTPQPPCTTCGSFTDVPRNSPFYSFVRCLACNYVLGGYDSVARCPETGAPCFRPGDSITRGQMAKVVANAAGYVENHTNVTFTDVPATHTFYIFIQRLASRGVVSGYSDPSRCSNGQAPCFQPEAPVTRGQMSKFVAVAANFTEAVPPNQQTFRDVLPPDTFWQYIERLASRAIVGGYVCGSNGEPCPGTYFRPAEPVTRGQASKFVALAFFPNCDTLAGGN